MLNTKRISKVKTRHFVITGFVLFSAVLLTSCIGVNRQFEEVKDKIMGKLGEDYETEFQFSIGSAALHISSWFVNLSADQEYLDDMMREISSVQIGVFNRVRGTNVYADFNTLKQIDNEMKSRGWQYIVRSVENNEISAVYLNSNPGEVLKSMYVINLNDDELTIIEVNGNLKKVIQYAIEEKNFDLKM
ncbi:hypothetical protein BMS3Abin03_01286 [bacterium BMS3Abin03]|nr:hypothetical protein BMS3Abin03_01286 [bacterium BMS3Abin03]